MTAEVRQRQLVAALRNIPAATGFNIVLVVVLSAVLYGAVDSLVLLVWFTPIVLVAIAGIVHSRHALKASKSGDFNARNTLNTLQVLTAFRATLWGVGAALVFPDLDSGRQFVIASSALGLMSGGSFALAPVPRLAALFSGIVMVPGFIMLNLTGPTEIRLLSVLLLVYFFFLTLMTRNHGRALLEQIHAEMASREQEQTIAMLFREFEQSSSDWLWQLDRNNNFVNVSQRFAQALGQPADAISGTSILAFLQPDPEFYNVHPLDQIMRQMPLERAIVSVKTGEHFRYWMLTGSPHWGETGAYQGYRGVAADVTDEILGERALSELAQKDQLTGAVNRARFADMLNHMFTALKDAPMALVVLDINSFKLINDSLGHAFGDKLLSEVGARLLAWAREDVVVARLGGDEFGILLPATCSNMAGQACEELMGLFAKPFGIGPNAIMADISLGVAVTGEHVPSAAELMKNADVALYAGKAQGRGQVSFFDPSMAHAVQRRQKIERRLKHAIANDEMSLVFQPIVAVKQKRVAACEALLRWTCPELGSVSPAEFIPIAEETGQIVDLGKWVVKAALDQAVEHLAGLEICVNLSPAQLRDPGFIEFLRESLEASHFKPEMLTVEITEGVLLESTTQTMSILNRIKALGVRIALDDFGTGFSSLSYLRRFAFSKIKIDKSFVAEMDQNPANLQIIKAVVELGEGLGFEVVAEGVETQTQKLELSMLKCDYLQGYLLSPPVPVDKMAEFAQSYKG